MQTADQVTAIIEQVKREMSQESISASVAAWKVAMGCLGWAYVFGAYGEYCEPSNRRSRYSSAHPKIKEKCQNFNGKDNVPAGCVGCKWFLGTANSNQAVHEGRTRFFDCRGYIYYVLHQLFGMWDKCPAGCTTMWNTASNWKAKGTIKDGVPDDVLVCLFKQDEKDSRKMAHIGFGFHGETLECSSGVEYHEKRSSKWTHWAIPSCIDGAVPTYHPTIQKGSTGPAVVECQDDLIQLGYDVGPTGADGKFGAKTEAAVKAFQGAHGLKPDGICGPDTWAALESGNIALYTVRIEHLSKTAADEITGKYGGVITKE